MMNVETIYTAGLTSVAAAGITVALMRFYLIGYLGEKGKNLATKEDVAEITDKIEGVKVQYALLVEGAKVENQLRIAALDSRLEKAQQAFTLWRKLFKAIHGTDCNNVVLECQEWWERNCLYLEPSAREAFSSAYSAAGSHAELLRCRADVEVITRNFAKVVAAGDVLVRSVSLPGLTKQERMELQPSAE